MESDNGSQDEVSGILTALVTPFKKTARSTRRRFRALVNWQIEQGSHGLVPVGTTGESPTLNHDEHHKVVEWCIAEAKGRVPVIAGAGSNSTREAVAGQARREGGGERGSGGDAVLQQADPAGPVPRISRR